MNMVYWLLLLPWQPALLSYIRCTSDGSFAMMPFPQPRGPSHLQVSSVAAQSSWVRVASKWMSSSRSTVEGCDPGSSLGHAHPHGGATTSSASANGCCGKTFPRARRRHCCPPCMCWPCACCALRLTVLTHDALCVRVHDPAEYVFASQSRAPQGRLKSPKFKSGLQTEFQIWW